MKSVFFTLFAACLLTLATGCDGDSGSKTEAPKLRMTIEATNLTPLTDGFLYKAWAKVGDEYIGTEAFNVTSNGQFRTAVGQFRDKSFVLDSDVTDAELYLISIEGKSIPGDGPSDTVILAADASGFENTLTTSHPRALGASFVGETGQLTIMTPSDTNPNNETHGLWYLTVSGTTFSPGLSLPPLNSGWKYEGWVEVGGTLLSTGTFTENTGNDSNSFSFPDVPQFPGEDFMLNPPTGVTFPLNLDGAKVSISAEPFPDNEIDRFGINVLSVTLPTPVAGGSVHQLSEDASVKPSASILIF